MHRVATALLVVGLLLSTSASAAFVDGIEHFDGTELDMGTWRVGDYGDGLVTQSDALTVDWQQEYSTVDSIGYPATVSVDVLSAAGTTGLHLGTRLRPHLPMRFDWYAASIGYDRSNRSFSATLAGAGNQDTLVLGLGLFDPPSSASPYRLELERPNRDAMIFRAYDSAGELLVEATRSFSPRFADGSNIPLYLMLGSCCVGQSTFDDVRAPLPHVCGNDVVESGEACDDGNREDGDCCSSSCAFEASGASCSDGNACNGVEFCDGAGICIQGTPLVCDDGNVCTQDSCVTESGCSFVGGPTPECVESWAKGALLISEITAGKEKLVAELLNGPALSVGDFGDPISESTVYDLCIYRDDGALVGQMQVDRAGALCDGKECYRALGARGYLYRDNGLSADGIQLLRLLAGETGKTRIFVKGKNDAKKGALDLPVGMAAALAGSTGATIQFHASDAPASCLGTTLVEVLVSDGVRFKAK